MRIHKLTKSTLLIAILGVVFVSKAEVPVNYNATVIGTSSNDEFAPYYISSLNHGIITQSDNSLLRLKAWKPIDKSTRFSYGFGVDVVSGYSSGVEYQRFDSIQGTFYGHKEKPANIWLQQLYGEIKYRGVFVTVGLKEHQSKLYNNKLGSGDFVESGNSRPIPEIRTGFIDFQDIPFTNGWLQIEGEISYGIMTDSQWWSDHYNYFNNHIAQNSWYTYKRAYFRTNPDKPFSVTFGAQSAATFGGHTEYYKNGKFWKREDRTNNLGDMFDMFIPRLSDKEGYVAGNHLGSWDIMARYRFKNNNELKAYVQWPWEDGSGIGKLNGFDGIWGIEYKSANKSWINGAVIEYIDFTNQSGPLHWAPNDNPGTTITDQATGGDEYYNNAFYNSYAHYGMSIGTPFLRAPIYNTDGYPMYVDNLVRGFHAGIMGNICKPLDYRLLVSYREGWGDGRTPRSTSVNGTSFMTELNYKPTNTKGLEFKAQIAYDHGSMLGNNLGYCVTVSYDGLFNIGEK